ncbi:hypothetical protein MNBD_ALPHA04-1542, partial [hydrothermal vent metagenome]
GGQLIFFLTGRNTGDASIRLTATATGGLAQELAQPDIITIAPGGNARPITVNTFCGDGMDDSREITVTLVSTDLTASIEREQATGTITKSAQCRDNILPPTAPPPPPIVTPPPPPDPIWPIIVAIVAATGGLAGAIWFLTPKPGLNMTMRTGTSKFDPEGDGTFSAPILRTSINKRYGLPEFPDPLPVISPTIIPPENST